MEDFDLAAVDGNPPPLYARVRVEGAVIKSKPPDGVDIGDLAGLDRITADFQLDYRLDPEKKTMSLNRLELDLQGPARLQLSVLVDRGTPPAVASPDSAMT